MRFYDIIIPSYDFGDYAIGPEDAEFPELWEGLVGLWSPSTGPTGLDLPDLSGNGNPGQLTNMVAADAWVVGEKGYALDYDGSNDVVQFDADVAAITGDITVSCWFNKNAGGAGSAGMLVGRRNFDVHNTYQLGTRDSDHAVRWVIDTGTPNAIGAIPVPLNEWHLATGTWIAGGTQKLYIDGEEVATGTKAGLMTTDGALDIGGPRRGGFNFNGQMGDVFIHNRVLLPNEIADMYAGASPLILKRRAVGRVPVSLLMRQANLHGNMQTLGGGLR